MERKTRMLKKDNKNKKSFVKGSVKAKLIILMIAIALIPLNLAIGISYLSSTNKAKEDAQNNMRWEAKYLESEVNKMLLKSQSSLVSFASSHDLIAFLKGEDINLDQVKSQMIAVNEAFGDDTTMVLSNTKGDMVLRSDDSALTNIAQRDYFQAALAGNIYVSNIFVSSSTNSRNLCIAVPVKDGDKTIGVLHKAFDPNEFHILLNENAEEAFLVDAEGTLVAHSQYEISVDDEPLNFSTSPYMTDNLDSDTYVSVFKGEPSYLSYNKDPFSGYTVCVVRSVNTVINEARISAMTIVLVGVIMVVAVLVIAVIVANSFVKPILEVNGLLSSLAGGEFKKINLFLNRDDEIGQMINNSNAVVEKLKSIVNHIKESSNTVNNSSEELSVMANQIAATTENVAEAVQEIATGASEQAKEVQDSVENAGYITEAIEGVQNSTNDLNDLAQRMKEASESSSQSLTNFHDASAVMANKIEDISAKISATQNAVAVINERVEGISGIAAQTNLLSLNASIEAARAGDAGNGFAVVAEEIRKLADDSESLAKEIHEVMENLLSESQSAVDAANEIIKDNKAQQLALATTIDSVKGMIVDIEKTVESVEKISGETDTCVSSNANVSHAMSSLSAISEENAAATETTGASVEELSATVTTLADSANSLKDIADKLNEEMKFFK